MSISETVTKLFNNIGKNGKTAPPSTQDTADAILHELIIAQTLAGLATKRVEQAKENLQTVLSPASADKFMVTKAFVKKQGVTQNVELVDAEHYNASARLTKGRSIFDINSAKEELALLIGDANADKFVEKYTKHTDPSVTFIVTEH